MASFANKHNKMRFDVVIDEFEYCKLSELFEGEDVVHNVRGMYLHKGKMGVAPVFIVPDKKKLVNIPAHLTDTVKEILSDPESIEQINAGVVGFRIYKYESHGKECYGVNFVDM